MFTEADKRYQSRDFIFCLPSRKEVVVSLNGKAIDIACFTRGKFKIHKCLVCDLIKLFERSLNFEISLIDRYL